MPNLDWYIPANTIGYVKSVVPEGFYRQQDSIQDAQIAQLFANDPQSAANGDNEKINIMFPPVPLVACVSGEDCDARLTAIINLCKTRKCSMFVPYGTFFTNERTIADWAGVQVIGASMAKSTLKLNPNRNTDMFVYAGSDSACDGSGFYNINLDGNAANQSGTNSILKITSMNKACRFEYIYFSNGGHGLTVAGAPYAWTYTFCHLLIQFMGGCGINGLGTDNTYSDIVIGPTTDYNFKADGANCRIQNIKCMGSTGASGMFVYGSRMQFNNIDSQESFLHGIQIQFAYDCSFNGIHCDNNGFNYPQYTYGTPPPVKTTIDSYGISIESGLDLTITGYTFSNRNELYRYGIGAFKIWNGVQNGNYASQRIKMQVNDEKNPGAIYISGTNKITFASGTITSSDSKNFTGYNIGEQVAITGCTVNPTNNKYATITGVADKVLTFAGGTFTAGAETAAIKIRGAKCSQDLSYDGTDFMVQGAKYIEKTASWILEPEEIGTTIFINSGSAVTCTVPTVANSPAIKNGRPVDTVFYRMGAGTATFAAEAGNFVNGISAAITAQYGSARLRRRASADDRWVNAGNL